MKQVVEKREDIAFYIKMYPITNSHPDAYRKSKAIVCEKSLKLLGDAFEGKPIPDPKCDTKAIDENIKLANRLGIKSVPSIILPDGKIIAGAVGADELIKQVDRK